MSNFYSTRWRNPIALAFSAIDLVSKQMLNDPSFRGTYGALLSTFYHDIPCDRVFSENLKNISRDLCDVLYAFLALGREWDSSSRVTGKYTGTLRGMDGPDWRSSQRLESKTVKTRVEAKICRQ
ncbi:hypothetical protein [Microcoleus sp. bin38.metabat.b11b12b14.051]|uniref:hypothetical protein n=1 Tax=Microcoleus sp. bin38.metabat.b11b12b14.051 TaxID=2742709 RepID=UPI0025DCD372|nr:hypothetical protein [Microcoleus sp. bin38.metabat.b11b12b14.051]